MKKTSKEKIILTAKNVLFELYNFTGGITQCFSNHSNQKAVGNFINYEKWKKDKGYDLLEKFRYLVRKGYIEKYLSAKGETEFKLTEKGIKKVLLDLPELENVKRETWDKKWRIVVFDVSEKCRKERDYLRALLKHWKFLQLQKSVYVYPFDCLEYINRAKASLNVSPSVQYILADRIESEVDIINYFLDEKILKRADFKQI